MPHIRFRCLHATPDLVVQPDDVVDVPTDQAAYLVRAGTATYVDAPDQPGPVPVAEPESEPDVEPDTPTRSASKRDWVAHAVSVGMDPADAEAFTRDELAERYLD